MLGYRAAQAAAGLVFAAITVSAGVALPGPAGSIVETYRMRAECGDRGAQAALGAIYLSGTIVPQSDREALHWFTEAARQGDTASQIAVADLLRDSRQVEHNRATAAAWYRTASAHDPVAGWRLGQMYESGDGLPQDYVHAAALYRQAAIAGVAGAQNSLGDLYLIGAGVRLDYNESLRWYRMAAASGFGDALLNLAGMYYQGLGVKRSYATAYQWALKAAAHHVRDASAFLAEIAPKLAHTAP